MKLLRSVWLNPRATVREAAASRRGIFFAPLTGVFGATHSLNKVITRGVDPSQGMSATAVLGLNLVFGFLLGMVLMYGLSFPLSWIGRRLGGVASPRAVRTVLGLASVPFVPLLIVAVSLALLGPSTLLVRSGGSPLTAVAGTVWAPAVVFYLVSWGILSAWLCVIGVLGLSEVHAFSVSRSVASYLIIGAALLTLFMLIIAMVVNSTGGA
jgi:hypothetical protein